MAPRKSFKSKPRVVYTAVLTVEDGYGNKRKPHDCVLQNELKDKYPEITHVFVDTDRIAFTIPNGDRLSWPTPWVAKRWIMAWDEGDNSLPDLPVSLKTREAKVTPRKDGKARSRAEKRRVQGICKTRGISLTEYNREKREHQAAGKSVTRTR